MEFYPRLHQTQLLARQVTGKNLAVTNADGRLELGVSGVNVRQIVVLVVDQVQTDDDAVEHGNNGHGVVLLVSYWRQFMQSIADLATASVCMVNLFVFREGENRKIVVCPLFSSPIFLAAMRELAQAIWDKHGVCVQSVRFSWVDVSGVVEQRLLVTDVEAETLTKDRS